LASVFAIAVLPDQRILAGGEFWEPAVNLVRLSTNGAWDETFNAHIGDVSADPIVAMLAVQPNGRILVGGANIRTVGGLARYNIARLNPGGSVDSTFDPGLGPNRNWVYAITLQPDGNILVGGSFTEFNATPAAGIVRLQGDTGPGFLEFRASEFVVSESAGSATITLQRSGGIRGNVDVLCSVRADTASPGRDYEPGNVHIPFADGEMFKTFTIKIHDDGSPEPSETVNLELRNPRSGARIGAVGRASLTIVDDD
jgi:uncharacterized delta-60 repeat protein